MPYDTGPDGEAPGSVRRQKEQAGSMGKSLYCGFYRKEQDRKIEQV